jgi:hypothetical protein
MKRRGRPVLESQNRDRRRRPTTCRYAVVRIAMLSAIISFLTGCGEKPKPKPESTAALEPPPAGPGTSIPLAYPVVLAADRRLFVYDDEESLTTTSVATGKYYPEFVYIDSAGMEYEVIGVAEFGRKPAWRDMGTSPFRVFLKMKAKGKISLEKAKPIVLESATKPEELLGADGKANATRRIGNARSFPELIEVCRRPWRPE